MLLTFFFLMVILGATDRRAPKGFAPLAIGLSLTLIHLISIPITNTSVNPARSTGPALLVGEGWAVGQLWLFWLAPLLGAAIAGVAYRYVTGDIGVEPIAEEAQSPRRAARLSARPRPSYGLNDSPDGASRRPTTIRRKDPVSEVYDFVRVM